MERKRSDDRQAETRSLWKNGCSRSRFGGQVAYSKRFPFFSWIYLANDRIDKHNRRSRTISPLLLSCNRSRNLKNCCLWQYFIYFWRWIKIKHGEKIFAVHTYIIIVRRILIFWFNWEQRNFPFSKFFQKVQKILSFSFILLITYSLIHLSSHSFSFTRSLISLFSSHSHLFVYTFTHTSLAS